MKKILTLLSALFALTACQDDLGLPLQGGDTADGLTDIYLAQPDMPVVITRADGSTDEEDSRVESVILFVFDNQGNLLNQEPVQQSVTPVDPNPDNGYPRYRFRAYLPSERHSLYAVCNYDAPDELISFVKNLGEINGQKYDNAKEALQAYVTPAIASAEDAYKGVYVMEGHTENFAGDITIPVKRILSRHTFTITFDPVVEGDGFKLSSVSLFNVPRISKLVDDQSYTFGDEEAADADRYTNWRGDAVYSVTESNFADYYLGTDPGDYATGEQTTDTKLLDVQQGTDKEGHDTYTATAHLYENRRGAEPATEVDAALLIDAAGVGDGVGYPEDERENIRQLFKRALALGESPYAGKTDIEKHPYATCLVIEGLYDRADENAADARVRYFVYLGHDNYGDFNVQRNHNYEYDITIKAADRFDTRVKTQNLAKLAVTVSKENEPFDAHFNVREALIYSSLDWEVYVENPDATPWLEVSTSATYIPRPLGNDLTDYESNLNLPNGNIDEGRVYAQYRLKGRESLKYFYIHTDEYVPKTNELTDNGNLKPRTGKVIVKCGEGDNAADPITITVTQYPAQLVEVTAWDINQAKNVTRRFFVERIVEEKYKNWGFTHFWNLTLDNLISTGNYDGLNNTRKEYVSAIWGDKDSQSFEYRTKPIAEGGTIGDPAPLELNGKQNAADWEETEEGAADDDVFDPALKGDDAIFNLSSSYALGYALAKNRDRNGNGRIDYNEIMWYLPAREQLAAICKALNDGQLKGTDYEETNGYLTGSKPAFSGNYWSSTPSVADKYGITTGRAYYHTFSTSDGKSGIGLRDQSFNVIVCRDADGWTGPETGGGSGDVNIDPDWSEEPDVNMPGK